jgi:CMP/dCMP kinase
MIIAIDGPAASGKGTLAKRIAEKYDFAYLDTGMLYRAVGRDVLKSGASLDDAEAAERCARLLDYATLGDPLLRSREMGEAASKVAVVPGVRAVLLQMQRDFRACDPGAVVEGRDIGTVIFPDAEIKLYITADIEERARRRARELTAAGAVVSVDAILADLQKRDARDQGRAEAPLTIAPDAHLLDTTKLDIEQAFFAAVRYIDAEIGRLQRAKG